MCLYSMRKFHGGQSSCMLVLWFIFTVKLESRKTRRRGRARCNFRFARMFELRASARFVDFSVRRVSGELGRAAI